MATVFLSQAGNQSKQHETQREEQWQGEQQVAAAE